LLIAEFDSDEGCHHHWIPRWVHAKVAADSFVVLVASECRPGASYSEKDIDGGVLIKGLESLGVCAKAASSWAGKVSL
jgi:hypothetical protein